MVVLDDAPAAQHRRGHVHDDARQADPEERAEPLDRGGLEEPAERRQRDGQADGLERGDVDEGADGRRARVAEGQRPRVEVAAVEGLGELRDDGRRGVAQVVEAVRDERQREDGRAHEDLGAGQPEVQGHDPAEAEARRRRGPRRPGRLDVVRGAAVHARSALGLLAGGPG